MSNSEMIRKAALSSFAWEDPFRMDDQLSDEDRVIRDTTRGVLPREPHASGSDGVPG